MLKTLIPIMALSAMATMPYNDRHIEHEPSEPRPQGYEHKGKTPARLEKRRANRKRLKAKRNAKRGVYQNKIRYHKKRA